MDKNKRLTKWLAAVIIPLLFVFQRFASSMGNSVAEVFSYNRIDEYGVFARISVHHIIQMLIALLVIAALSRINKIDFGFHIGDKGLGIKHVLIFSIAMLVYTLVSYAIFHPINRVSQYGYPLNLKNVIGYLGFQLILSGPSEEILFRALPISIITFLLHREKTATIIKPGVTIANVVAALLFSIAHIRWGNGSFSMSMDYFQLIYAFILGILYGHAYQRSGSVIYPMIMHSVSNVFMVGFGYIFAVMGS